MAGLLVLSRTVRGQARDQAASAGVDGGLDHFVVQAAKPHQRVDDPDGEDGQQRGEGDGTGHEPQAAEDRDQHAARKAAERPGDGDEAAGDEEAQRDDIEGEEHAQDRKHDRDQDQDVDRGQAHQRQDRGPGG